MLYLLIFSMLAWILLFYLFIKITKLASFYLDVIYVLGKLFYMSISVNLDTKIWKKRKIDRNVYRILSNKKLIAEFIRMGLGGSAFNNTNDKKDKEAFECFVKKMHAYMYYDLDQMGAQRFFNPLFASKSDHTKESLYREVISIRNYLLKYALNLGAISNEVYKREMKYKIRKVL